MQRDIFLDRDGVINYNRGDHIKTWEEFTFLPGALNAMARLNDSGYRVFIITNQAVINRGLVTVETLGFIHYRMTEQVEKSGGRIEAVLYCPHRPEENCACRKPRPGLIERATIEYGAQAQGSWLVGDHFNDINAGRRAGCRTIMVMTGRGRECVMQMGDISGKEPLHIAPNLECAVDTIIRSDYLSYQFADHSSMMVPEYV